MNLKRRLERVERRTPGAMVDPIAAARLKMHAESWLADPECQELLAMTTCKCVEDGFDSEAVQALEAELTAAIADFEARKAGKAGRAHD